MRPPRITAELLKEYKRNYMKFRLEQWVLDNGQLLKDCITDWQYRKILKPLDDSRYSLYYIQLPKKSGKSTLVAYEAVTRLFLDGLKYPAWEGYFLGGSEEQAAYLWNKARRLIEYNPNFHGVLEAKVGKIDFPARGIQLKVLSSKYELTHQYNPDLYVFDEFWNQPDRKLFDAMFASAIKPHAKGILITNAGEDQRGICWEIREKCRKNCPPNWYYWEPEDLYTNPMLKPPWITDNWLRNCRDNMDDATFARLILNKWVKTQGAKFLSPELIESAINPDMQWGFKKPDPLCRYWLGLDVGLTHDLAVAIVAKTKDDFMALEDIQIWKGNTEDPVQIGEIENYVIQADEWYPDLTVVSDPWQSVFLNQRLQQRGIEAKVLQPNPYRLAPALKSLFINGLISFPYHERLVWELRNATMETTQMGVRISRTAKGKSLDCLSALGMIILMWQEQPDYEVEQRLRRPLNEDEIPHSGGEIRRVQIQKVVDTPIVSNPQPGSSQYWRHF